MLAKLKDRLPRQREKERSRERERLWQGLAYLPPCSAWGNQKWLTTTSVAASRKWRFVKYLFADRFYRLRCQRLPMSACLCSTLSLLSLFSPSPSRLHDFYLMNFANFLMQHLTHAKGARSSWLLLLLFLLFAKFFSPTCLRIHDVQIIVSILEILRFAAVQKRKKKAEKQSCALNEKGAPAKDYRAECLGAQRATGVA